MFSSNNNDTADESTPLVVPMTGDSYSRIEDGSGPQPRQWWKKFGRVFSALLTVAVIAIVCYHFFVVVPRNKVREILLFRLTFIINRFH